MGNLVSTIAEALDASGQSMIDLIADFIKRGNFAIIMERLMRLLNRCFEFAAQHIPEKLPDAKLTSLCRILGHGEVKSPAEFNDCMHTALLGGKFWNMLRAIRFLRMTTDPCSDEDESRSSVAYSTKQGQSTSASSQPRCWGRGTGFGGTASALSKKSLVASQKAAQKEQDKLDKRIRGQARKLVAHNILLERVHY